MHFPVLLREVVDYLDLEAGDVVFDGTLGGGGHAVEILNKITPGGRLIGVEKDLETIEIAREKLKDFGKAVTYVHDDYREIDDILNMAGTSEVDGALLDLGISSFQVDDGQKGFSFLKDGPLDMRFDKRQELTAKEAVNEFSREELSDIIKKYGEERYARLLAGAICKARKKRTIETTGELTDIINKTIAVKYRKQALPPAARTFQALRIYVNDELNSVEEGVRKAASHLRAGKRICVISFNSLEDRIVKNVFRDMAKEGHILILTKKPQRPGSEEIKNNPRARSAKLRVAERI